MTPGQITAIEARLRASTPGPWTLGSSPEHFRVADTKTACCPLCATSAPVVVQDKSTKRRAHFVHVHPYQAGQTPDWHRVCSRTTTDDILGNYADEEGGVCSTVEDAVFIAAAPDDIAALLAEVRRLQQRQAAVLRDLALLRIGVRNDWFDEDRPDPAAAFTFVLGHDYVPVHADGQRVRSPNYVREARFTATPVLWACRYQGCGKQVLAPPDAQVEAPYLDEPARHEPCPAWEQTVQAEIALLRTRYEEVR